MTFRSLPGVAVLLALTGPALAADPPKEPAAVSYYRDIRPIFQQHCQGCHQPAKPLGGYIMTTHADLLKEGDKGQAGVVPGKPAESFVIDEIKPRDNGKPPKMPKGKPALPEKDVALIAKWIEQGAKDDTPLSARELIDQDHPPVYVSPPVVSALDYSPDGSLLAVSGHHEVILHHADGSGIVARLIGLSEHIQSVTFSPDGKYLAVAAGSPARFGEIQIWNVEKRKLKLSVSVTFDTLFGVSWAPDSSKVAFGCTDNTLRAINLEDSAQVLYMNTHTDWVLETTFSADGSFVASVSRDRSVRLTEVATQRFIDNVTSITPGALKGGLATISRRPQAAQRMVKSPPDPRELIYDEVLIGGSDGVPRLYKLHREVKRVIGDDANKVREFEALPGRISCARFNADGTRFVIGSSLDGKGEARVYKTADKVPDTRLLCLTGVPPLAMPGLSTLVLLGDYSPKATVKLQGEKGAVYAVAYRPDGAQVATAGFDGVIRLYDPNSGKLLKEFVAVPMGAGK